METGSIHAGSAMQRFIAAPPLWALIGILVLKTVRTASAHLVAGIAHTDSHDDDAACEPSCWGCRIRFIGSRQPEARCVGRAGAKWAWAWCWDFVAAEVFLHLAGVERAVVILVAGNAVSRDRRNLCSRDGSG
jgi:hypothetical protein